MKKIAIFILAGLVVSSNPAPIHACGPYFADAVFAYRLHPDLPLSSYAAGGLGILQPTYARSYLYVAYRTMMGIGFDREEQAELDRLWDDRLSYSYSMAGADAKSWIDARNKVQPAQDTDTRIDSFKTIDWQSYPNCNQDAFDTAAATLQSRIEKFGAESEGVKAWVAAQDQVFANCSGQADSAVIPSEAPATLPIVFRADRNYQVAAAYFYAGDFLKSRTLFQAIGLDASSPWKAVGPYLAARALIRQAQLGKGIEAPSDLKLLQQANEELARMQKELEKSGSHPDLLRSAARLQSYVKFRLDPVARAAELAPALLKPDSSESLYQDLWDYTAALDLFAADTPRINDLTEWLFAFQSPDSLDLSLKKWKETASLPWLVAVLSRIPASHSDAQSLLAASAKIGSDSPAYLTVSYHRARLWLESGKTEDARQLLDALLKGELPASARNRFLEQRMPLALSLPELLTLAQRTPIAVGFDWYNLEMYESDDEGAAPNRMFPPDAAAAMNTQVPLDVLRQAAAEANLDPTLRSQFVKAVWTRAVLLDRTDIVRELAPEVRAVVPATDALWDAITGAPDPESAKFAAIFLILWHPGLEPIVESGPGRDVADNQIHELRDNWWCSVRDFTPDRALLFLDDAGKLTASREHATLVAQDTAPDYLCAQVLSWARAHPDDSRVPEALYLAVRSTRFGCNGKNTSRYSREAFQFLHQHYPKSGWTAKTPYYY